MPDGIGLVLNRNGYVDQFDDWVPQNSWSGETTCTTSDDVYLRVKLKVYVQGRYHGFRARPYFWNASLRMDHIDLDVASGRCKSLKEVYAKVEALDLTESIQTLLKQLYTPKRAYLVYRQEDRPTMWGILTDRGAWEPWCTAFGYLTVAAQGFPPGRYLALRNDGERTLVTCSGCTLCTQCVSSEDFDWLPQKVA